MPAREQYQVERIGVTFPCGVKQRISSFFVLNGFSTAHLFLADVHLLLPPPYPIILGIVHAYQLNRIDKPDIRRVIHYGAPKTMEE
jgi:hypothetical protein